MVKRVVDAGRYLYVCEECGFGYESSDIAEECEAYCLTNHACSLEITRRAVHMPESSSEE